MLATLAADAPMGDDWSYEIKGDGIRGLVAVEAGRVGITSRLGNDLSGRYPELAGLPHALGGPVLLAGGVVAFDNAGRPSFEVLQQRMHVIDPRRQAQFAAEQPVAFMVFDVVWHAGASLLDVEYLDRRGGLTSLALTGPDWQTPASGQGADDGTAMVEASRRLGLEGIVAKRSASRYTPGKRSREWLKVKHRNQQELVVGGWVEGQGSRRGSFGALLVGWYDDEGALHFAGRVGSGFSDTELDRVGALLAALARPTNPFAERIPLRQARFVEPRLVCDVEFGEWTSSATLRHPRYKGLRDDKAPEDVRREP